MMRRGVLELDFRKWKSWVSISWKFYQVLEHIQLDNRVMKQFHEDVLEIVYDIDRAKVMREMEIERMHRLKYYKQGNTDEREDG